MRHRGKSKIKREHQIIPKLLGVLQEIEKWEEVTGIIPARIKPIKRGGGRGGEMVLTAQALLHDGVKCLARGNTAVQEVFIIGKPVPLLNKIVSLEQEHAAADRKGHYR